MSTVKKYNHKIQMNDKKLQAEAKKSYKWFIDTPPKTIIVTIYPPLQPNIYSDKVTFDAIYSSTSKVLERYGLKSVAYYPSGIGATGGWEYIGDLLEQLITNPYLMSLLRYISLLLPFARKVKTWYTRKQSIKNIKFLQTQKLQAAIDIAIVSLESEPRSNLEYLKNLAVILPDIANRVKLEMDHLNITFSISIVNESLVSFIDVSFRTPPSSQNTAKAIKKIAKAYVKSGNKFSIEVK